MLPSRLLEVHRWCHILWMMSLVSSRNYQRFTKARRETLLANPHCPQLLLFIDAALSPPPMQPAPQCLLQTRIFKDIIPSPRTLPPSLRTQHTQYHPWQVLWGPVSRARCINDPFPPLDRTTAGCRLLMPRLLIIRWGIQILHKLLPVLLTLQWLIAHHRCIIPNHWERTHRFRQVLLPCGPTALLNRQYWDRRRAHLRSATSTNSRKRPKGQLSMLRTPPLPR
jgi:hypothetical protein